MNLHRSGRSRSYIPNPEWQDCKINLLMLSTSSRAGTGTFTSRLPSPHSDPVQTVDWYFAPVLTRDFPMVRKIIHNNIANYLFHMMFPFQDEWSSLNLHQSWHNNTITTKVLISFSTNHRIQGRRHQYGRYGNCHTWGFIYFKKRWHNVQNPVT